MLLIDKKPLVFRDLLCGMMYKFNTGETKAVLYVEYSSLIMRLELLGFVQDKEDPTVYWLYPKEETNGI